jgi:hypothetical protein
MRIALKQGQLRGIYKSDKLNPMVDMPLPHYESMMAVANGQHPEEFRGGASFGCLDWAPQWRSERLAQSE